MAKMILLDTDVLIDFFRGYSKAVTLVNKYNTRIILSSIVVAELFAGVKGDMEEAFKKAIRTSRLDDDMITETKKLLEFLGIPYVDAEGEGEAQAAYMNARGDVDLTVSQDFDSLLFGAPILIRNLTVTGKRKLPDKQIWINITPEEIQLQKILDEHNISREALVDIGILIGTDFNEGIKGIGPKKALALIKDNKNIENLITKKKIPEIVNYQEVRNLFLNPRLNKNYTISWKKMQENKVVELLCNEHQFTETRISNALKKYKKFSETFKQKNLFEFK